MGIDNGVQIKKAGAETPGLLFELIVFYLRDFLNNKPPRVNKRIVAGSGTIRTRSLPSVPPL